MKDITLDLEQMKELADHVAKRSASISAQPLEVKKFVNEYMKAYTDAYDEISKINEQIKKKLSKNL